MTKYRIGVIGLKMGASWAKAAHNNSLTELSAVYDLNYNRNNTIDKNFFESSGCKIFQKEDEFYSSNLDIIIVASPDHFHTEQSVRALASDCHVICEKPLAPTVNDCRKIIKAVEKSGKKFMTGQVCRYAPGFVLAKKLVDEGRIGKIAFMESEYAHNYSNAHGFDGWRKDPKVKREGFIGGGCHAMDMLRWFLGSPKEISCYTNKNLVPDWPTNDTGIAICKFHDGIIGKVFVSVGVKRPYSMRTVIYGTEGSIICDNTSSSIQIYEERLSPQADNAFSTIPVTVNSHNVESEFNDFINCLENDLPVLTDVYEGTRTVAFGESALLSAKRGYPIKLKEIFT